MSPRHVTAGAPLLLLTTVLTCEKSLLSSIGIGVSSFSPVGWNGPANFRTGFVPTSASRPSPTFWSNRGLSPSKPAPPLSMAIERMSDECVGALMTSHKESNKLGLKLLLPEMMMAGVIGKPERASRTLAKYGITFDSALESATLLVRNINADIWADGPVISEKALPFSALSKTTLGEAVRIADGFDSASIRSEHVLLALLGYNDNTGSREVARKGGDVLLGTAGLVMPDIFSVRLFCEELAADLKRLPMTDVDDGSGEGPKSRDDVVVIGGSNPGKTATLDSVGVDLTQMALEGKLDMVYGRDKEIRMCLRTLGRRRKNNPCLIGEPGVGKTAIAEAIAQVLASSYPKEDEQKKRFKIDIPNPFQSKEEKQREKDAALEREQANGDADDSLLSLPQCPKSLAGYRLISVDLASLVAGTRNRGDFEEKVQNLIKETANSNIILFIDEIHNLIGTGGGGDGSMNAANLMKPALARGELRLLGATTTSEYRRYIEKDGALERRFQPLKVKEPTVDETMEILGVVMPYYEEYHNVEYTPNAMWAAAKLSDRYVNERFLPDKAIDLLDEAGSMVAQDSDDEEEEKYFVTEDAIAKVVAEISGIPVGRLDTGEKERLRNLEEEMGNRIKGQERAVRAVSKAIRRARSGLRNPNRPVASFLFCGPTGVGKTEVCKSLAETYFGQEKDMIRIDMSEYMDRFSTSRLVGAPPGYVGYDEGGQLTEAVRRSPHSLVLFDELEKAHEDVLNILLQVMDEGKLTDGKGNTVSFRNTIFVMTSNVASSKILEMSKEGPAAQSTEQTLKMANVVKEELEQTMKPELLNRIDEIVVFSPLSYTDLRDIAANILAETVKRASDDQDMSITVSDALTEKVALEGFESSGQYGARPVRRAAQRFLEDPMSEAIMGGLVNEGDEVLVDVAGESERAGFPDRNRAVVKITRVSDNGSKRDSILVQVEDDAGIGSVQSSTKYEALNRPMPPAPDESWE